jgi:hypothetical protein
MKLVKSAKKLVVVAMFALVGLSTMAGSTSAAADGDLDISTMPPQAQWRINPAHVVQIDPAVQVGIGLR